MSEFSPRTSKQSQTNQKLWYSSGIYSLAKLGHLLQGGRAQLQHQGKPHIKVLLCSILTSQLASNMLKARGTSKCLSHPKETFPVEFFNYLFLQPLHIPWHCPGSMWLGSWGHVSCWIQWMESLRAPAEEKQAGKCNHPPSPSCLHAFCLQYQAALKPQLPDRVSY